MFISDKQYRAFAWGIGLGIYGCMGGQLFLLGQMGLLSPATALPLHLCSFCGAIALPVLVNRHQSGWEFLLLLGLPGALGALLFPSILQCPWQRWMDFFFMGLHTLLVIAALLPLLAGMRPRPQPWGVLLWGNGLVLMALAANDLFRANFLFLQSAPWETPLVFFHQWGPWGYLLWLEALAVLIVLLAGLMIKSGLKPAIGKRKNRAGVEP